MAFKLIGKTEFSANVLTLMTGTAIAQAIPIAISPILTRLFTPEDFGILGFYLAIVTIISVFTTGRYEFAIMLPKKDEDAACLLTLSSILAILSSFIILILVIIFQDFLLYLFIRKFSCSNQSIFIILIYLIPVSVLTISSLQILNNWSTRSKTFKSNAAGRISQSVVYSLTSLGMGYGHVGASGLIIGNILGNISASLILLFKSIKSIRNLIPFVNKKNIKSNASTYKDFPIIGTPHALLNSLQDHGVIIIITYFFSSLIVGLYSFTIRIMQLPLGLIGASFSQVFYQKASTLYNNNVNIQPVVLNLYKKSFLIGLPIFLFLFLFAPWIFAFIFGANWKYAGEIAQIITPWIFINFISGPVSSLILITNNQKKGIIIAAIDFIIRITSLVIGGLIGNFKIGAIIMTVGCSILLIYFLFWIYKIAGQVNNAETINTTKTG